MNYDKIWSVIETVKWKYVYYEKEVLFTVIIFFTAILSFGLGYLANREFSRTPIVIEQCSVTDNVR